MMSAEVRMTTAGSKFYVMIRPSFGSRLAHAAWLNVASILTLKHWRETMTAARSHKTGERTYGEASDYVPQTGIMGAEAVAEAQREIMSFVAHRLEKDSDAFRDFGQCTTMADAVQVQVRWAQETMRDYGAEMTKLVAMWVPEHPGGGAGTR
jgi:hypothetical protein